MAAKVVIHYSVIALLCAKDLITFLHQLEIPFDHYGINLCFGRRNSLWRYCVEILIQTQYIKYIDDIPTEHGNGNYKSVLIILNFISRLFKVFNDVYYYSLLMMMTGATFMLCLSCILFTAVTIHLQLYIIYCMKWEISFNSGWNLFYFV